LGGSFDIDFEVKNPSNQVIHSGEKQQDGDFVFTVDMVGEYSFCFSNKMSTVTDKVLIFEIDLPQSRAQASASTSDTPSPLEDSLNKIHTHIDQIHKMQNYFKTRESVRASFQF